MLLLAMLLAGAAAPDCSNPSVKASLRSANQALNRPDLAAAKAAIAPAAACPITSGLTYAAHVLAADVAVRQGDWAQARALLADAGVHSEVALGARTQFLRMRADQGLADADAFAADRSLTLVANDARLTAAGTKLESFHVPGAEVIAYRTPLEQGAFHRVLEFVATPDDKAAYPVTIMLTDDVSAAIIMKTLNKDPNAPAHAWFVDLYRCDAHRTLAPVGPPNGAEPAYAAVKARVVAVLSEPGAFAGTPPPDRHSCMSANWLVPGFGLRTR